MKKLFTYVCLFSISVGCDSASQAESITPQVIYTEQSNQDISYQVDVLAADVFEKNKDLFLLARFRVYAGKDVIFKLIAPSGKGYTEIELPESKNTIGKGAIDIGSDKLGQVYIPFKANDEFRVYRYSQSKKINYIRMSSDYTEGVIDQDVMALLSRTGKVDLVSRVDQLFLLDSNQSKLSPLSLSVGRTDSLHDIQLRGDDVGLVLQSSNRSEFWYYLVSRETGEIKSKILIEGLDFLTRLSIVSSPEDDEVVIAEKRASVRNKKVSTGFVRINLKDKKATYEKFSPKIDGNLAVGVACETKEQETPFALYTGKGKNKDNLYLTVGSNDTHNLVMPSKSHFQQILISGKSDWRVGIAVYESVRDYTAFPYLALLPIHEFIDCNN